MEEHAGTQHESFEMSPELGTNHRATLARIGFTPDELRLFSRDEPWQPLRDVALSLLILVAAPVVFLVVGGFLGALIAIVLNLHSFSRLASLVHYSDHGSLFSNRKANWLMGNLCAYVMGYTRAGHRVTHEAHHAYLNTVGDTDKVWGGPEDRVSDLLRALVNDLLLVTVVKRLLQYMQSDRKTFSTTPWDSLSLEHLWYGIRLQLPVIPAQAMLLGLYWILVGAQYYALLYIVPMFTIYPVIIRLRSHVEHSFPIGVHPAVPEDAWYVRSTQVNLLERLIIVPLGQHLHFEHHLLPGVAYYNLPAVRRAVEARGLTVPHARGYFSFLYDKWRQEKLPPSTPVAA